MHEGKWTILIVILTVLTIMVSCELIAVLKGEAKAETVTIKPVTESEITKMPEPIKEKEEEMISRAYGKLTEEEKEYIIKVVAAEARGESMMCMMATAQTMRDRALEWNKNIMDVAKAPCQFADPYEGKLSSEVRAKIEYSVEKVIEEGFTAIHYPVLYFFSERYIDKKNWPSWAYTKEYIRTIDGERFYR